MGKTNVHSHSPRGEPEKDESTSEGTLLSHRDGDPAMSGSVCSARVSVSVVEAPSSV